MLRVSVVAVYQGCMLFDHAFWIPAHECHARVITTITLPKWASQSPKGIPRYSPSGSMLDCPHRDYPARINETYRFAAPSVHPLRYTHQPRMMNRLASLVAASCITVVLHAGAQDNLPGTPQNPSSSPDCSDPLLANSSQCATSESEPDFRCLRGIRRARMAVRRPLISTTPTTKMLAGNRRSGLNSNHRLRPSR